MQRLVLTVAGAACLAMLTGASDPAGAADEAARQTRNEGYGLFYGLLSDLGDSDKILYVKLESDPVEAFVERLAETSGRMASRLESFDESDDGLRLDVTGLPEVERRSREAIRESQVVRMAPLAGESGAAFERTLLLGHVKALDQLRHMAAVLLEVDDSGARREFLRSSRKELERLHADVERLLEERYFCAPGPAGDDGAERDGS